MIRLSIHKTSVGLLTLALLAVASRSFGSPISAPTILTPGSSVTSLPNFADAGASGGLLVLDEISETFTGGIFTELVVTNTAFSPFGSDYDAFAFDITMTSGSLESFSEPGYGPFETAVKETTLAQGNPDDPVGASRSADGNVITFSFVPGTTQTPGLAVYTNASFFVDPPITLNLLSATGTAFSVNVDGLAPAVVPEPTALVLLGSGLAALMVRRRRAPAVDRGE